MIWFKDSSSESVQKIPSWLALMSIGTVLFLQGCQQVPQQEDRMIIADNPVIDTTKSIFPLSANTTQVDHWINPSDPKYQVSVLTTQEQQGHFVQLKSHYFGKNLKDASPWNAQYLKTKLAEFGENPHQRIVDIEQHYLHRITHPDAAVYGENYRRKTLAWKYELARNTDVNQFLKPSVYQASQRAISLRRSDVRTLPTDSPVFENPRTAGQGYPFDLLQNSSLVPATPVYIIGQSNDQQWNLILAPEVLGWVKARDLAKVNEDFVSAWRESADESLGAIVDHDAVVMNVQHQVVFSAQLGTILPILGRTEDYYQVAIPVSDIQGQAVMEMGYVTRASMRSMPWAATPEHFAVLMHHMVGRPYGWGGLYGNNDCSSELRQMMLTFGIFLPRNSKDQSQTGEVSDQSDLSVKERLAYLKQYGKPFRSIVYIGGHVMLYIGQREDEGQSVSMTYQNIWGLRPEDGSRRSIIGQSVFLPLVASYKQDTSLQSLAAKKWFVVTDIGALH